MHAFYVLPCCSVTLSLLVLIAASQPAFLPQGAQEVRQHVGAQEVRQHVVPAGAQEVRQRVVPAGSNDVQLGSTAQLAEAGRVSMQQNQYVKQRHIHRRSYRFSTSVSARKLPDSLIHPDVPRFHSHHYYGSQEQIEHLQPKYLLPARRLLVQQERSHTAAAMATLTTGSSAMHTPANTHGSTPHEQYASESTAFHADYSVAKTHPPKNN